MNYHESKTFNPAYSNAFGVWQVKSPSFHSCTPDHDFGIFEGYIDDIAFHLAGKARNLAFKRVGATNGFFCGPYARSGSSVQISLDIDSGTWDMVGGNTEIARVLEKAYAGRSLNIMAGSHHASVIFSYVRQIQPRDDNHNFYELQSLVSELEQKIQNIDSRLDTEARNFYELSNSIKRAHLELANRQDWIVEVMKPICRVILSNIKDFDSSSTLADIEKIAGIAKDWHKS